MRVIVRRVDEDMSAAASLFAATGCAKLLFDADAGVLVQRVVPGTSIVRGRAVRLAFTERRAAHIAGEGAIAYEIACGASFDGGATFSPEARLEPSAERGVHTGTLMVPESAAELHLYARVKAIAIAGDGERVVLCDAYDNPSGAFTHYAFPVR